MNTYKRPIRYIYTALCAAMLLCTRADAYIDPATTSYIIQIVAAFFITLGVLFSATSARVRLVFVKIKMKLLEEYYRRRAAKSGTGVQTAEMGAWRDARTYGQRLWLASLCAFAIAFTFIIYGCYDLFFANSAVMPFVFRDIWLPLLAIGLCTFLVLSVLLSLTRGKVYDFLISLFAGIVIAGYVQGNFLNLNLGQLTGDVIQWENYKWHMLLNALIWFTILALPFVIRHFSKLVWKAFCAVSTSLIVTIQAVALIVVFASSDIAAQRRADEYLSTRGIYEFSKKENIVVFIMDRLDENYIKEILRDDPAYFDDFDGFERYTNNLNYYCRTYPSVVNMLTGDLTFYDEYASEFVTRAYQNSTIFKDLQAQNYQTKLYMERSYTYTDIAQLKGIADNCIEGEISVKAGSVSEYFLYLSAFRYMPFSMKPSFFVTTADFSDKVEQKLIPPPYLTDDYAYYRAMLSEKLTADMEQNNFIYVHLNGSHAPLTINEKVERVPKDQTSTIMQTKGCFNIAREMIRQMKALGIYDDATIIITGDHGKSTDFYPLDHAVLTGLFVKKSGSFGTTPTTNNAPVNSDNLRGTIAAAGGFYEGEGGTGEGESPRYAPAYWDVPEDADIVRKYYYRVNGSGSGDYGYLEEFEIVGQAGNFNNWEKIREIKILYPHA